jgi:hypothetical protein
VVKLQRVEEEELVLDGKAADIVAEDVLAILALEAAGEVVALVGSVERGVEDAIPDGAVEVVGAVFEDEVGNRAAAAAELSLIRVLEHDYLLDGVEVFRLQALAVNAGVVVVRAFNEEVVGAGAAAIDREVDAVGEGFSAAALHARQGEGEEVRAEALDGKVVDGGGAQRSGDGARIGFELGRSGGDFDGLVLARAHREALVDGGDDGSVDAHGGLSGGLEVGCRSGHFEGAGGDGLNAVAAHAIGGNRALFAGLVADGDHCGARDGGAGGIGDGAGNRSAGGLSVCARQHPAKCNQ